MRMADTCLEAFKAIRIEFHFKKFNPYLPLSKGTITSNKFAPKTFKPSFGAFCFELWTLNSCKPHFQGGNAFRIFFWKTLMKAKTMRSFLSKGKFWLFWKGKKCSVKRQIFANIQPKFAFCFQRIIKIGLKTGIVDPFSYKVAKLFVASIILLDKFFSPFTMTFI